MGLHPTQIVDKLAYRSDNLSLLACKAIVDLQELAAEQQKLLSQCTIPNEPWIIKLRDKVKLLQDRAANMTD